MKCQALLSFRSYRQYGIYDFPDDDDTWLLIAKGVLRELDDDSVEQDWVDELTEPSEISATGSDTTPKPGGESCRDTTRSWIHQSVRGDDDSV